jgi:hypothetical protein
MNQAQQERISRIAPVTDAEAARMAQPDTIMELAAEITAMPVPPASRRHSPAGPANGAPPRSTRRRPLRRRWLIGVPLAVSLAAAALIVTTIGRPGQPVHIGPGPAHAQVLSFTRHGGYIDVIVRDPLADPRRYRAEFARHHLKITLKLVPASPSLVGTVVFIDGDINPITAKGTCYPGDGGACSVGVRIPDDFHGQAAVVFGRRARPGERYASTASAFAPGEVMHGMRIRGRTVAEVLAMLRQRHVTVPEFRYIYKNFSRKLRSVPGTWYVYDAVPWAPRQIMLFVGPARKQANAAPPATASPSPSSSP